MQPGSVKGILFIVVLLTLFNACKSSQEMVYMQNFEDGEYIDYQPFSIDNYILKPGDNLYIQITSANTELNSLFNPFMAQSGGGGLAQQYQSLSGQYLNGYLINQQGMITLPVVGQVELKGQSMEQANHTIQTKVNEYINDATVIIKLINFRVTVLGEVYRPSVVYAYNNTLTLLEAISQSGGTNEYSRLQKVNVVRETPKGKLNIKANLNDKNFLSSPAFYLQPNDIVYVQPDRNKNLRVNLPVISTIISAGSFLILILTLVD